MCYRSKLCGDKPHASTINRISHEQCQAEIAQLSAQNAELQSQLQSCTEQITVMHGRVEKADTERYDIFPVTAASHSSQLGSIGRVLGM